MTKTNAQAKTVAKSSALAAATAIAIAAAAAKKAGQPDKVVAAIAKGKKVLTAEDLGGSATKPKLTNGDKPKAQLARGIAAANAPHSAKAVSDQAGKASNKADAATQKPAKAAAPKTDKASDKAAKLAALDARKIVEVVANPKREGTDSYLRFAKYKKGMTVAQALAAGVLRGDIDWDSKRDFIKFA